MKTEQEREGMAEKIADLTAKSLPLKKNVVLHGTDLTDIVNFHKFVCA